MFSKTWETSKRQYEPVLERNVAIPVRAGFTIDCNIARPDSDGKFPAIVSIHPFYNEPQFEPMMPRAINPQTVTIEGGDYNFYVRRGYVMVMTNCRGTADRAAPSSTWETA